MAISKAQHLEFVRLRAQLKAVDAVIGKLHASDAAIADREISDLALPLLNKLLLGANAFLGDDSPIKGVLRLPVADPPKYGDVLLLTNQLLAAFEAFKVPHVQYRHASWYWLVKKEGEDKGIDYVRVDPLAEAESGAA